MAAWVSPVPHGARIVASDASLCEYYLGRCDFVLPGIESPKGGDDPVTGVPRVAGLHHH